VTAFDPDEVRSTMAEHGLEISALAYYPNNLHPDDAVREEAHAHLRSVIDAAQRLGVATVGTFERAITTSASGSSTRTPRISSSGATGSTGTARSRTGRRQTLEELADEQLAVRLADRGAHALDALHLPPRAELDDLPDARARGQLLLVDVPAPVRKLELERVAVRCGGDAHRPLLIQ
jgi:sugar phosphate isomerase/epimerase